MTATTAGSGCSDAGYELGFRTFVLQSGEDLSYTTADICRIVSKIRNRHPDCAVTLSIGEKSRSEYQAYYDAGAERYLLRQETSNPGHYRKLHPPELSIENRKRCLYDLREIGYQVGYRDRHRNISSRIFDSCRSWILR